MKRIALCFDGTWQSVDDPASVSNVVRLAQAIKAVADKDNIEQITYYQAGVGSDGGLDSFLGGLFGVGLRNNVKRALAFLSLNYTEQDEIYIFGFSRGARGQPSNDIRRYVGPSTGPTTSSRHPSRHS